jgi:acyl-coenzyme A synthetase/AMP-(fatty) acid ligase
MLPLIHDYRPQAPLLWLDGAPVSQAAFLAAAWQLASELPDAAREVLPLAANRAGFMLAFAAALLRNKPCLLPPAGHPAALASLRAAHPSAVVLSDQPAQCIAPGDHCLRLAFDLPDWTGPVPELPATQLAAIAYTSGSTGAPQPNAKTWAMLIATARLAMGRFGQGLHIAATVPAQHMYGLETTVMMALAGGGIADAGQPFFPQDVRATLAALPAPRMLVTTPVHLRALVAADPALPELKLLLSATAPLPLALAQDAEARFNAPLFEIYGCTEAGSIATRRPVADLRWRLYPELKLETLAAGSFLHADYLPDPVPLADEVECLDGEHFRLLGRSAELIKVAGKRIALAELTQTLLAIAGVEDGVVLLPEADEAAAVNQRPAALVVAPGLSEAQLLAALAARLDPVFLPRPLKKVASLPRNAVGKLPRAALLELLHG